MREVEAVVGFEGRVAGSDPERRAAAHLTERLRALGREAELEPTSVWPNIALTHALHALLAVIGSVVSAFAPVIGVVLAALALLSALGDMTGTVLLVRRLTGRRASQNVVSPEDSDKHGALVIVAHLDAARGGTIFGRRIAERRAAIAQRLRLPIGLGGAFLLAIAVVFLCTVARLLGFESVLLSIVQFVPTALLIVAVALLLDVQVSPPSPGAGDNAAGVATALRLAERHGGELENLDLWVVLTGAEEAGGLGMREFLRRHRADRPPGATFILNIDKAGTGTVRYSKKEGLALPVSNDRNLVAICDAIADDDEDGRFGARAMTGRSTSDALVARAAGYPAVTVSCLGALDYQPTHHQESDTPDRVDPAALDRAFEFCSLLVRRIDADQGPQAAA